MAKIDPVYYRLKSGQELLIRALEPTDAEKFLELSRQVAHDSTHTNNYVGMEQPSSENLAERLRKDLEDPKTLVAGVVDQGRVVGFLNFYPERPGHPWFAHVAQFGMMIAKELWGQGVGKKLLEVQDSFAKSVGVTRIEGKVRAKNDLGLRLYQRNGFQVEGFRRKVALINGQLEDEYFIAKLLDDPLALWRPTPFETDRLLMRPLEVSDAPAIFEYAQNPAMTEYTQWEPHQTLSDSLSFIKDYAFAKYAEGTPEPYGITLKGAPDRIIGTVGAWWTSKPAKTMELGYALSQKYWGQGYMPEAAASVMERCFVDNDLNRVQARCISLNKGSARVMQKIGMQFEGTLRSSYFRRGKYWDMSYYALIK